MYSTIKKILIPLNLELLLTCFDERDHMVSLTLNSLCERTCLPSGEKRHQLRPIGPSEILAVQDWKKTHGATATTAAVLQ